MATLGRCAAVLLVVGGIFLSGCVATSVESVASVGRYSAEFHAEPFEGVHGGYAVVITDTKTGEVRVQWFSRDGKNTMTNRASFK